MNVHGVLTELTARGGAESDETSVEADAPCHCDHGDRVAQSFTTTDPYLHSVDANHVRDDRFDIPSLRVRT
ncbi:MAG: hypothetical protein HYV09_35545 [Deltaproteobacteria bacterium]|nr:hypothetical protein [Deltaproteobacteria bacterium]